MRMKIEIPTNVEPDGLSSKLKFHGKYYDEALKKKLIITV